MIDSAPPLGALPLGRLLRTARTAEECGRAIEQLPEGLRTSPVVPGGLMSHEGTGRGHLLARHVRKSRRFLLARFEKQPYLPYASSFKDRRVAEASSMWLLEQHAATIGEWLKNPREPLQLLGDFGSDIGRCAAKDGTMVRTTKLRLILSPERSVLGYHIRTGHPTP